MAGSEPIARMPMTGNCWQHTGDQVDLDRELAERRDDPAERSRVRRVADQHQLLDLAEPWHLANDGVDLLRIGEIDLHLGDRGQGRVHLDAVEDPLQRDTRLAHDGHPAQERAFRAGTEDELLAQATNRHEPDHQDEPAADPQARQGVDLLDREENRERAAADGRRPAEHGPAPAGSTAGRCFVRRSSRRWRGIAGSEQGTQSAPATPPSLIRQIAVEPQGIAEEASQDDNADIGQTQRHGQRSLPGSVARIGIVP
ncbi:MAG: hypothetical protein R3D25_17630 [Geminicoccaceae bacterium]